MPQNETAFYAAQKEVVNARSKVDQNEARLVVQLPMRSQMTLGGLPRRMLLCRKSESLETMAKPCSKAYCHI
jgi:hypothetical protein